MQRKTKQNKTSSPVVRDTLLLIKLNRKQTGEIQDVRGPSGMQTAGWRIHPPRPAGFGHIRKGVISVNTAV